MQNPFYFSRPSESFAPGSPGFVAGRILGRHGPVLSHEAWEIGCTAYSYIGLVFEQPPSERDLALAMGKAQWLLDEALDAMESPVDAGELTFVQPNGKSPQSPRPWRDGSWTLQVTMIARFMKQQGAFAHAEAQMFFGPMLLACLLALEDAVLYEMAGDTDALSDSILDAAWLLEQVDSGLRNEGIATARLAQMESARASDRAKLRHARDPKRKAKDFVRECWTNWRSNPSSYPSASAFARAMLDKMPEELTSEVVVTRWVREWNREMKSDSK